VTAIIDYGVGNLFSLKTSLAAVNEESVVTSDADVILDADRVILPGVGAFGDAAAKLRGAGLDRVVHKAAESGKPLLGICLGMQLLFETGYEFGTHSGLGLIPGEVVPISRFIPSDLKIPHIGWNVLKTNKNSRLLGDMPQGSCAYFVHSFSANCDDKYVSAYTEYGAGLVAAVERGNVFGCQFHPEKSGNAGLAIIKKFSTLV